MTENIRAATTVAPKVLIAQTVATTGSGAVYTVPAGSTVKIATATVCNSSLTASVSTYVSVRKAGDTIPWRVANFNLAAAESFVVSELVGAVLGPGDGISIGASDTTNVNFVVTGVVAS